MIVFGRGRRVVQSAVILIWNVGLARRLTGISADSDYVELASIDGCTKRGMWPSAPIVTLAMRRWCWTTSELHEWKMRHEKKAIAQRLDRNMTDLSCTEAAALLRAEFNGNNAQMGAAASSFFGLDRQHTDPFIADPASVAARIRVTPAHITDEHVPGANRRNATQAPFLVVLGAPLLPGGGPGPWLQERMLLAIRRYFELVAANESPYLLLTGGGTRRAATGGLSEASVMQRMAQEEGVPPERLLLEGKSEDTLQNAVFSGQLLVERGARSVEVITSGFHVARARSYFEPILRAFGSNAALSVHGKPTGLGDGVEGLSLLTQKERLLTQRSARVLKLVVQSVHEAQADAPATHTGL